MANNNTLKWRVGELEKDMKDVKIDIRKILENHLPHIQQELVSLKTRITIATSINVAAITLALILNKYL